MWRNLLSEAVMPAHLSIRRLLLCFHASLSCGQVSWPISRTVCELMGWKRRSASLKARECRESSEQLDACGRLLLPDKRPGRTTGRRREVAEPEQGNPG